MAELEHAHRKSPNRDEPSTVSEAATSASARQAAHAAGHAVVRRAAHSSIHDLGTLDHAGKVLAGVHTLKPGETLRFSVAVNQIRGLGEVTVDPPGGALKLVQKELHAHQDHVLGSTTLLQYSLTMAADAQAGSKFTVHCSGNYQVRSDPDWAFSFTVVCG
jgi:hypothetical protein